MNTRMKKKKPKITRFLSSSFTTLFLTNSPTPAWPLFSAPNYRTIRPASMNDFIQCVPFIYRVNSERSFGHVLRDVLRSFSFNFWYELIEEKCYDAKCIFESILWAFWNVHRTRWTRGKMFTSWFSSIHVCNSTIHLYCYYYHLSKPLKGTCSVWI